MAYRRIPVIHTLELEKYDGLVVRMKGLKIGEMRRLVKTIESDDLPTDEIMDAMIKSIADNLVSWTLQEEDGTPVPDDYDGVESLDFEMLQEITGKWLDRLSGPGEELGKDSSGGERFPGLPLTMEAL